MLETIKQTLQGIGDFFVSIGELVIFLVKEIFEFFGMVTDAISSIPQWYVALPSAIVSIVIGLVACKFILRLVGR